MGPTGYGGLFRRLTRTFTGGVEPDNNTEAQIQRDSPRTNSGRKMCPNKYPGYFMTVEILREFLKKNFGLYDPQIKIVMDDYVFMTPERPLSESQRKELSHLTDRASH